MKQVLFLIAVIAFFGCSEEQKPSPGAEDTPYSEQRREPVRVGTDMIKDQRTASSGSITEWPEMRFDRYDHDFGDVPEGTVVETKFTFRNTGTSNLIIYSAKGTCGCTVPEYPREPIPPGEEGSIVVTYDSANRKGIQRKSVNITANTNPNVITLNLVSTIVQN
ncbi:MAG: DUF1573 domain-containing protein [Chitinophagaceae bacterium]|nr:MAG: DUF1573 domain-containing protein [Chitinophagaceae bacterium]